MTRILETRIDGYKFHSQPQLVWHSNKFWFNEVQVKEVYNNGSMAMVVGGVKRGKEKFLKELRKKGNAYKCTIVVDCAPF